jgi:hypothetical protein
MTLRCRLRTLLIAMALGPPILAWIWLDWATVALICCYLYFFVEAAGFVGRNTPFRH